ncbi:MAG: TIM barrel protein [Bacteroidia bacterium]|nr:TIM barrel protein [Bacteroidia bacterium]
MNRRTFVRQSVAAAAGVSLAGQAAAQPATTPPQPFKLRYAPHFGMFENHAGKNLLDQLKFMADEGFTALEDNGMPGRPVAEQEKIAAEMQRLRMDMGVFVVNGDIAWMPSMTTGDLAIRDKWLAACRHAVEVAKRVNAKWMTVVPGFYQRSLPIGIQTAHVIDWLRRGCEIFEPHGLVMVLEPLSDTPDLFLRYSDQTFMICKAVNSPSCKLLFDMYHMQKNEGHIIYNIDQTWDEIPYFQIGDNPGRKEPTSGEMNYKNIFKHIHSRGYTGILGMEHGNAAPGKEGERALINAYREVDGF